MSTYKVFLGVVTGVAIGAAMGVLFAPDKGSSTRKKIARKGQDYVDGLGEKFNSLIDGITHQVDTVRHEAKKLVDSASSKAQDLEAEASNAVHTTKSKLRSQM
jgi:gas vesicle protein